MNSETLLPLLPALPLVMAAAIGLAGNRAAAAAGWVATAAVFLDLLALICLCAPLDGTPTLSLWPFWRSPALDVSLGLRLDAVSALMLLVVFGVGGLIHLYAVGYMARDPGRRRFFSYLNLFIGSMALLVLAENLVTLFFGWEGVGLCSYLLIGFWYEREAPRRAAIKAFLVNRVGDVFFLAGLLVLTGLTGTGSIAEIAGKLAAMPDLATRPVALLGFSLPLVEVVGLCLALGACAKSAQFPLHTWLPDAMEGPAPVSALIHAATMVTAGVYLVVRMQPLFAVAPLARELLLTLAVLTALGGACVALAQYDLKRLLAWSTISQVGFMMAAATSGHGAHGGLAALAHLVAHAFFKSLLFLAAGAIALSLHGVPDIRRLAGFHRRMPWTAAALVTGCLGLAGIAPFAGFFSKDAVLSVVATHHPFDAFVLFLASLLTALYAARLIGVLMLAPGLTHDAARDPGAVMLTPMGLLAAGTLGGGVLLGTFMPFSFHGSAILLASLAGPVVAAGVGVWWYRRRPLVDSPLASLCRGGFGIDRLYDRLFVAPARHLALWVRDVLDRDGIDALLDKVAHWIATAGDSMRVAQTGRIGDYLVYIALALALMFWAVLP